MVEECTEIRLTSEEEAGVLASDKSVRFDIVAITPDGSYVNIVMQKDPRKYYFHRAVYYSSRLVSREGCAGKSESSAEVNKVYGPQLSKSLDHGIGAFAQRINCNFGLSVVGGARIST